MMVIDSLRPVFLHITWEHWVLMGIVSVIFVIFFFFRKRATIYSSIALGLSVFFGLFILDALALSRIGVQIEQHPEFNIIAEYQRLIHLDKPHGLYMLYNVLAFVPFGLFLSEFLSENKHKRNLSLVALTAFGLSLLVESLQWFFRAGLFEVTDMVLNTLGALIGAAVVLGARSIVKSANETD